MDDLIRRQDALGCFHDWVDRYGDVHSADEMVEYQRIEAMPSVQPTTDEFCTDCKEYDAEKKSCPRFNRVIRSAMEESEVAMDIENAERDWDYNEDSKQITLIVPKEVYESATRIFLSVGHEEGHFGLRGKEFRW